MKTTRKSMGDELHISEDGAALAPMWVPDLATIERSNLTAFMRAQSLDSYDELYRWSIERPAEFWAATIERLAIPFNQPTTRVLADHARMSECGWLPDARLNIVESCLLGPPEATALLCGNEEGDELTAITYGELAVEVRRVASGLRRMGLQPGDAVALFSPMNARSVSLYLGAILAGCVVVSIADSFSHDQVMVRLRIGAAKAIVTKGFLRRGTKSISLYERTVGANLPVVLTDDDLPPDIDPSARVYAWHSFLGDDSFGEVHYAAPAEAINVLFSSGTTGDPKAIPWNHATPLRAASDGHFHHDIHPGDVVAWPTNFGWMMGPWLTFATLINRGTMALFEGSPLSESFGRFVQRAGVNILGVIPSLITRWRDSQCMEGLDWSAVRLFSSTGECSNAADMRYVSQLAGGKPIIEYCGGTELGGGYIASTVLHPNIPSTFSTPTLGSAIVLLDENDQPADVGEAFMVAPAIGMSHCLLNGDHEATYYHGVPLGPHGETLRRHGDQLQRLPNGYFRVLGRTDDAINLGGIKVGSAELERVVMEHAGVTEVAMIGVPHPGGGPNRLVACIAGEGQDAATKEQLRSQLQQVISDKLCPLFKLDDVFYCEALPRTASNKVMRRQLRSMYEQQQSR